MAVILAFRTSTPVIHIDGADQLWTAWIERCPIAMLTVRSFDSADLAVAYARNLKRNHGWSISLAPDCGVIADGAA